MTSPTEGCRGAFPPAFTRTTITSKSPILCLCNIPCLHYFPRPPFHCCILLVLAIYLILALTRPRLFDCCISPLSLVVAVVVVPRLKNQQVSYVGYGHFPYFLRTPTAFPCKNNARATFCDMLAAFLINVARNYG